MDYADGLKDVLIRKINKAERGLNSLKLDYCRFVFGLTHRSKVMYDSVVYQVRSVDLDSMTRSDQGEWTRPIVYGARLSPGQLQAPRDSDVIDLGRHWELFVE
jgi:hypothetical protein